MDEFGVFDNRYGKKAQGKSAPTTASKRSLNKRKSVKIYVPLDLDLDIEETEISVESIDKRLQDAFQDLNALMVLPFFSSFPFAFKHHHLGRLKHVLIQKLNLLVFSLSVESKV
ncbi:hypothetical protein F2Q70_00005469 [Brassica cretica]|uniref:Uncharacterized protein n=1 Tax=Brassica cretica TaxID=69181 RepID=A0A8S9IPY1_BRACR|nr:hypothetical protein F2Q70_00005469 [Brassica cretica]